MTSDVFISYSSHDTIHAKRLRDTLESSGISCWMAPESIPGGSNYAKAIPKGIRNCKVFVLVFSSKTPDSIYVPKELDLAIKQRKLVLPFILENIPLPDDYDFLLTNAQHICAYEEMDEKLQELVTLVNRSLGRKQGAARPGRFEAALPQSQEKDPKELCSDTAETAKKRDISAVAAGVALVAGTLLGGPVMGAGIAAGVLSNSMNSSDHNVLDQEDEEET